MTARPRIEVEIGRLLAGQGMKLAVAESCTGGMVGQRITSVPGSSDYFVGGIIAYSNEVKASQLGVGRATLKKEGAVSAAVAGQMAAGARSRFSADVAVAVTGIAGPGGGSTGKPVGLVFVALAGGGRSREVRRFIFKGNREAVRQASSQAALQLLRRFLKQKRSCP